jgi:hypothetical protein
VTTPLWVPLVVAAVGVLGTLFAAVFTQVWQSRREEERARSQAQREDSQRWFEARRAVYTEVLRALRPWQVWARTLRYSAGKVPRELLDPELPEATTFTRDIELLMAEVDLLGTTTVADALRGLWVWVWVGGASVALAEAGRSEGNRDAFLQGVEGAYADLIEAMRTDLGLPRPAARSTSPPGAPLSS